MKSSRGLLQRGVMLRVGLCMLFAAGACGTTGAARPSSRHDTVGGALAAAAPAAAAPAKQPQAANPVQGPRADLLAYGATVTELCACAEQLCAEAAVAAIKPPTDTSGWRDEDHHRAETISWQFSLCAERFELSTAAGEPSAAALTQLSAYYDGAAAVCRCATVDCAAAAVTKFEQLPVPDIESQAFRLELERTRGQVSGCARLLAEPSAAVPAQELVVYRVLPRSSDLLIGFNLVGLRGTLLWKRLWPLVQPQLGNLVPEVKAICGLDALSVLEGIIVGGEQGDPEHLGMALQLGIPNKELVGCVKAFGLSEGEQVTVTDDGVVTSLSSGGESVSMASLGPQTLFTVAPGDDGAVIRHRVTATDGMVDGAPIMRLAGRVDRKATMWLAMATPPGDDMDWGFGVAPSHLAASVDLRGAGLRGELVLQFDSQESATEVADLMRAGLRELSGSTQYGEWIRKISVVSTGSSVRFVAAIDDPELGRLADLVQPYLPLLRQLLDL